MSVQILALLESDENSRQVVTSLTLAGFDVIACRAFTEAIEILKTRPTIEMIISDVHLQNGGTVFDFLRWLKINGTSSSTSLVLFSFRPTKLAKHLEEGIRISARLLGVAKYITMETFNADLFCKKIESVLAQQQGFMDHQLAEKIKLRTAVHDRHNHKDKPAKVRASSVFRASHHVAASLPLLLLCARRDHHHYGYFHFGCHCNSFQFSAGGATTRSPVKTWDHRSDPY